MPVETPSPLNDASTSHTIGDIHMITIIVRITYITILAALFFAA